MLGGVSRGTFRAESDDDDNPTNCRVEKNVVRLGKDTLETNPANIMAKKFDLATDLDVHFQQLSALFDAGSTQALLISNIDINDRLDMTLESEKRR